MLVTHPQHGAGEGGNVHLCVTGAWLQPGPGSVPGAAGGQRRALHFRQSALGLSSSNTFSPKLNIHNNGRSMSCTVLALF